MAKKELDRFDTNPKKDVQLATKLRLLLGGSIIVSCVLVCVLCLNTFNSGMIKSTIEDLSHTASGVETLFADRTQELANYASMLSGMQELATAMQKKDVNTVSRVINNAASSIGVSFLFVTDSRGKIYRGGAYNMTEGVDMSYLGCVKTALKGTPSNGIEGVGSFTYTIVAGSPILNGNKIVGVAVVGFDLCDGELLEFISSSYNVECTILKDDSRVATTIVGADGNSAVGTKLGREDIEDAVLKQGNAYAGEVQIQGEAFYGYYFPITSGDGKITGMTFVAKNLKAVSSVRNNTLRIVIPLVVVLSIALILGGGMFIQWLMWRIKNVTNSLEEMSTGEADLTKRCKLFIRDEIGFLVIHFDAFCDKLQDIISKIKGSNDDLEVAGRSMHESESATSDAIGDIIKSIDDIQEQVGDQVSRVEDTAKTVREISENITSLGQMIDSQSQDVSHASAAVEQMVGNITSVNTSVEKMASSFVSLSSNAQTGFSKQQDVNDRIKQIESQSAMLQEANITISSIAEQTNLLAMNAAIEAAHAGEAGKGFSVVADEIRKLSETSSEQSKTIGEQLSMIQEAISEVVQASTESGEALGEVSSKIQETDELVMQIKQAMEEQRIGSEQIVNALKSMNDSTQEVHNSSRDMSQKNERIMSQMKSLEDSTQSIGESMQQMSGGASSIKAAGEDLKNISQKVQDSIEKIGSEINLFKV